jgi:hypothetical protein
VPGVRMRLVERQPIPTFNLRKVVGDSFFDRNSVLVACS